MKKGENLNHVAGPYLSGIQRCRRCGFELRNHRLMETTEKMRSDGVLAVYDGKKAEDQALEEGQEVYSFRGELMARQGGAPCCEESCMAHNTVRMVSLNVDGTRYLVAPEGVEDTIFPELREILVNGFFDQMTITEARMTPEEVAELPEFSGF